MTTVITDACKLGRHVWTSWHYQIVGRRDPHDGGKRIPERALEKRSCTKCGKRESRPAAL